mmetsp:Transcript_15644/g.11385  ORF Transcript_15644/g.11385 Transcript_15644/m.11385 type:complete len:151 (+) Transcript_15644:253-705(+)
MIICKPGQLSNEASDVYDMALFLLAIYHLVEWFRFTIFLVAVFLRVNLIVFYYLLYLNTIYGFIVLLYTHAARFNEEGKLCEDKQEYRAIILVVDIIIFWITFIVMSFPQMFLKCMSAEKVERAWLGETEDDEDGEGEGDKEEKKDDKDK